MKNWLKSASCGHAQKGVVYKHKGVMLPEDIDKIGEKGKNNMADEIQWHSPFRGAVKVELSEYSDILDYLDEKSLVENPLFIDLLVIKKENTEIIDHPIGRIFRKLNIMEYKSPTDYVSIDRFYRACSYAYLLKSGAQHEDEIDIFDITITCVSKKVNQKLFNHLTEKRKYKMSRHTDGVYYFQKEGEIPIQFIIQEELDDKYKWLAGLTNDISEEMLRSLVHDYEKEEDYQYGEYKAVILDVVLKANSDLYRKIKEGKDMALMETLEDIFRPKMIRSIKKMDEMQINSAKIADCLGLDEEYVQEVLAVLEKYPEKSFYDVERIVSERKSNNLLV